MQKVVIRMKPDVRPQISRSRAVGSLKTPEIMEERIVVVVRRL